MAEQETKDFFQHLASECVDLLAQVSDTLADPLARDAVLQDLGAAPGPTEAPSFSADKVERLKAYRDDPHPQAQAAVEAIADMASLFDELISLGESWSGGADAVANQAGHFLLELAATNYFRLRFPRLFMVLQAVSTLEELSSTYGAFGSNTGVDIGKAIYALLRYIWQPGRSVEQLTEGADAMPGKLEAGVEFLTRVLVGVLAFLDKEDGIRSMHDVLTGWDAKGIDIDSPDLPRRSDVVSARMTSFSFGSDTTDPADPSVKERFNVSTALLHAVEGGPGVFLALGGSYTFEEKIGDRWTFSFKARADAGIAVLFGGPEIFEVGGPDSGDFAISAGFAATPPDAAPGETGVSDKTFTLKLVGNTRIDIGQLAFALTLDSTRGAEALVTVANSALVIDAADQDGFIAELIGNTPLRLPFSVILGYSSSRGLVREFSLPQPGAPTQPAPLTGAGNVGAPVFALTVPIGRAFGPVTVHEIGLRMRQGPADVPLAEQTQSTLEVDTSFSAQIGPVYLRLDELGMAFTVDSGVPPEERNLRVLDLHFDTKFPRGIAVNVETHLVAGGGAIAHDPDLGTYFGVLDLAFRGGLTLQAICLVATKQADGTKGFSLIAILTLELGSPWPLGMGFHLDGFGGLLALHRTFDEVAVRAALPTGQLRYVLFPSDPVHHTAEILHALQTMFPAKRNSHLAGVLVKIGWASPTLIQFELGVLYAWGGQSRLIILGRVSAILPRADLAILKLNMDAVGIIDFDAGSFALDAVLYDSKICDRFVLTGGMAMRMGWKDTGPGFALSVGGLHPKFATPAGFPSVARLQIALTNGDNPKLICQAYFAVTSNTVQFGADCSLYGAAYGFSITGDIGFDVLIQLLPFHFLAEFRASVQLKRGTRNLFKVSVSGALEGPLPLRVSGKASFEILWCDFSVSIDATLVDGGTPNDLVPIDVLSVLVDALSQPRSWQAQLPIGSSAMVSLRQPVTDGVLLHPLGSLTARQNVVPLGLDRDIDRVGTSTPSGDRRFEVTRAAIGDHGQDRDSIRELFAPGQYFDLSDDDRLAAPSFESMNAGVTFGDGGYTMGTPKSSPFDYTDITIDEHGEPVLEPEPHHQVLVLDLLLLGAASRAPARRTLNQRFAAPVREGAPKVNPGGYAAVDEEGPAPTDAGLTWVEAAAQAREGRFVVPRSELVG